MIWEFEHLYWVNSYCIALKYGFNRTTQIRLIIVFQKEQSYHVTSCMFIISPHMHVLPSYLTFFVSALVLPRHSAGGRSGWYVVRSTCAKTNNKNTPPKIEWELVLDIICHGIIGCFTLSSRCLRNTRDRARRTTWKSTAAWTFTPNKAPSKEKRNPWTQRAMIECQERTILFVSPSDVGDAFEWEPQLPSMK